jgi:hypothetical protein
MKKNTLKKTAVEKITAVLLVGHHSARIANTLLKISAMPLGITMDAKLVLQIGRQLLAARHSGGTRKLVTPRSLKLTDVLIVMQATALMRNTS